MSDKDTEDLTVGKEEAGEPPAPEAGEPPAGFSEAEAEPAARAEAAAELPGGAADKFSSAKAEDGQGPEKSDGKPVSGKAEETPAPEKGGEKPAPVSQAVQDLADLEESQLKEGQGEAGKPERSGKPERAGKHEGAGKPAPARTARDTFWMAFLIVNQAFLILWIIGALLENRHYQGLSVALVALVVVATFPVLKWLTVPTKAGLAMIGTALAFTVTSMQPPGELDVHLIPGLPLSLVWAFAICALWVAVLTSVLRIFGLKERKTSLILVLLLVYPMLGLLPAIIGYFGGRAPGGFTFQYLNESPFALTTLLPWVVEPALFFNVLLPLAAAVLFFRHQIKVLTGPEPENRHYAGIYMGIACLILALAGFMFDVTSGKHAATVAASIRNAAPTGNFLWREREPKPAGSEAAAPPAATVAAPSDAEAAPPVETASAAEGSAAEPALPAGAAPPSDAPPAAEGALPAEAAPPAEASSPAEAATVAEAAPPLDAAPPAEAAPPQDAAPPAEAAPPQDAAPPAEAAPPQDAAPPAEAAPPSDAAPPVEGAPSAPAVPSDGAAPPSDAAPPAEGAPSAPAVPSDGAAPPLDAASPTGAASSAAASPTAEATVPAELAPPAGTAPPLDAAYSAAAAPPAEAASAGTAAEASDFPAPATGTPSEAPDPHAEAVAAAAASLPVSRPGGAGIDVTPTEAQPEILPGAAADQEDQAFDPRPSASSTVQYPDGMLVVPHVVPPAAEPGGASPAYGQDVALAAQAPAHPRETGAAQASEAPGAASAGQADESASFSPGAEAESQAGIYDLQRENARLKNQLDSQASRLRYLEERLEALERILALAATQQPPKQ